MANKKPKEYSFEILSASDIEAPERLKNNLPDQGIVVKEIITHSPPEVKYHKIGKGGIVKLMKDIEAGKE